jgi:hypothetical protein
MGSQLLPEMEWWTGLLLFHQFIIKLSLQSLVDVVIISSGASPSFIGE